LHENGKIFPRRRHARGTGAGHTIVETRKEDDMAWRNRFPLILLAAQAVMGCDKAPDTPLARAAAAGQAGEVRRLVSAGAAVDERAGGLTPLAWAARSGQVESLRTLLALGADPALPAGHNGWTPLMHAIHKHQSAAAHALLDGGVALESAEGSRALRMAAGYGDVEMVRALLARGAAPGSEAGGASLLADAVGGAWDIDYRWRGCRAHADTVRALLEAEPGLRMPDDFHGWLALRQARKHGCAELLGLVERQPAIDRAATAPL
jgi:ankyrin repeat protein